MNYLLNKKPNNRKILKTAAALLLFLSFLFYQFNVEVFLSSTLQTISIPLWKTKNYLNEEIRSLSLFITSKETLLDENKKLKNQLFVISNKTLRLEALSAENSELKEAFSRRNKKEIILGVVLAKPNQSPYDTFILDIGSKDNIKKGDLVQIFDGSIIGNIEQVYSSSSKVKLFSSPGVKTEVSVGKENIYTTATGIGGGNFIMELPRGVDIEEGDYILLPNINIQIIGIVGKVIVKPEDSFQKILFKLPLNLSQLKWVQVIK